MVETCYFCFHYFQSVSLFIKVNVHKRAKRRVVTGWTRENRCIWTATAGHAFAGYEESGAKERIRGYFKKNWKYISTKKFIIKTKQKLLNIIVKKHQKNHFQKSITLLFQNNFKKSIKFSLTFTCIICFRDLTFFLLGFFFCRFFTSFTNFRLCYLIFYWVEIYRYTKFLIVKLYDWTIAVSWRNDDKPAIWRPRELFNI